MELSSIASSGPLFSGRVLRFPAPEQTKDGGEPSGPTGRVIEERARAARQALEERARNALGNATSANQERILQQRVSAAARALEARVQNALSSLGGPADTGGDSSSSAPRVTANRAGRATPEAGLAPAPDDGARRPELSPLLSSGGVDEPRETVLEQRASEARERLDGRLQNALSLADNRNQRRILETRMAAASDDLEARIQNAMNLRRGGDSAGTDTGGNGTSSSLEARVAAARERLTERGHNAVSGATNDRQLAILRERILAARTELEERIENALGLGKTN